MTEIDARLVLPNGRTVAYAQYGADTGPAILALHSTPGLRRMWRLGDAPARELGLRLVAPDRPGYGATPFHPERTLEEYPDDLARLADHLGLDRFALLGFSGGGFHASLVARAMPERITALGLAGPYFPGAGVGIFQTLFLSAARSRPMLLRMLSASVSCFGRGSPRLVNRMIHLGSCSADRQLMSDPAIGGILGESLQHVYRDRRGFNREVSLFARAEPLDARAHPFPVHLWQGTDDRIVLPQAAALWQQVFPDAAVERIPGAGHFWVLGHLPQVLGEMRRMIGT